MKDFNDYLIEVATVYENCLIRTAVIPKECLQNAKKNLVLYSIIDFLNIYCDYQEERFGHRYWAVLKYRFSKNLSTKNLVNCYKFKVTAKDGKRRFTDFMDAEHIYKLVEYITYSKVIICGYPRMTMGPNIDELTRKNDRFNISSMLHEYSTRERIEYHKCMP